MLPPFVPPSARAAGEKLPLITDFVIDRVEHSFESSFELGSGAESGGVATLPSIQEFVVAAEAPPTDATEDDEFVQRTSRNPWGAYEASREVSGAAAQEPEAAASTTLEADLLLDQHHAHPGSSDAVVNVTAEPVDAWTASAGHLESAAEPAAEPERKDSDLAGAPAASTVAPEVWMTEERDSFDWHAAASLAVPPAEAQRAADAWSSTEWDRSGGSVQDHIATLLAQISRRVRSGELEVQGSKQMSTEAALVAALSALLAESSRK